MSYEIECKVAIWDLADIKRRLRDAKVIERKPRVFERNIRYENQAQTLTSNDIVLRLRRDQQNRLTYKAPADAVTAGVSSRLELETTVGDYETMDAILQHVGFQPYMVYEKYRTTYELPSVPEAEIVLDELPFGIFIEVEGTPEAIDQVLAQLEMADARRITQSYAQLFDLVRERLHLTFADLTFETFADIEVDARIFEDAT